MRYIEVPGEIDSHNRLILHESLEQIKPQKVEIDIWFRDDDEEDYREPTQSEILDDIRESLQEYSRGESTPASTMWNELMIQSTGEITDRGKLLLDAPLVTLRQRALPMGEAQYVDVVIRFVLDKNYIENSRAAENIYENNLTLVREVNEPMVILHGR